MTSNVEEIRFPVITLAKNGLLKTAKDRMSLETCRESALRSGYFDGLVVVDISGRSWQVDRVRKLEGVGLLGGFRLLGSRRIHIQLELTEKESFDLAGLKARLCDAIDSFPHEWDAIEDIEDTKGRVRSAVDIPALIHMFVEDDHLA